MSFEKEKENIIRNLTSGEYVILEKPLTEITDYTATDKYGTIFKLKQICVEDLEDYYGECVSCGRRMYEDKPECDGCRLQL